MAKIQEHGRGPVSFAQTEKIEMLSDRFEKLGGSTLDKKRCSRSGVWPIFRRRGLAGMWPGWRPGQTLSQVMVRVGPS